MKKVFVFMVVFFVVGGGFALDVIAAPCAPNSNGPCWVAIKDEFGSTMCRKGQKATTGRGLKAGSEVCHYYGYDDCFADFAQTVEECQDNLDDYRGASLESQDDMRPAIDGFFEGVRGMTESNLASCGDKIECSFKMPLDDRCFTAALNCEGPTKYCDYQDGLNKTADTSNIWMNGDCGGESLSQQGRALPCSYCDNSQGSFGGDGQRLDKPGGGTRGSEAGTTPLGGPPQSGGLEGTQAR